MYPFCLQPGRNGLRPGLRIVLDPLPRGPADVRDRVSEPACVCPGPRRSICRPLFPKSRRKSKKHTYSRGPASPSSDTQDGHSLLVSEVSSADIVLRTVSDPIVSCVDNCRWVFRLLCLSCLGFELLQHLRIHQIWVICKLKNSPSIGDCPIDGVLG